jgi:hypothetical protein
MSHALEPIGSCPTFQGEFHLTFRDSQYNWSIIRSGGRVLYRVTDGNETFETPLLYAFGQGKAGQTYIFSVNGQFYESRVSYYAKLKSLDLTVGAANAKPTSLLMAAGRVLEGNDPRNCFGCHTTGARVGTTFQLTDFENGVQCESCHGPGAAHVAKPSLNNIRALRGMDAQETNEFCGACHRTWETVMLMGIKGVDTSRFPAYRITNSKCFSLDDRRIACTACHNPHERLVSDDKYYDTKCAACHNKTTRNKSTRTCPVGKQACTSCHMQRVETAGAHHDFPDHWIRVVKSKTDYPD